MWVWQNSQWPEFRYDPASFDGDVSRFHRVAERLYGRLEGLREADRVDALVDLMTSEAIKTSAIEGETLDRDSVRSSIKAHMGFAGPETASRDAKADGVATLMTDVRQQWRLPLTEALLCSWQASVIPDSSLRSLERGHYRSHAMEIVSGPIGRERVHYQAPPPEQVSAEMATFLDWYNGCGPAEGEQALAGPVRAGVAHAWFEMIHPFDDGNGRVGRAIADHALSQDLGFPTLGGLSSAIEHHRKDYYGELQAISRGNLDLNRWLRFFIGMVNEAQTLAKQQVDFVLDKTRFYDAHGEALNERQARVVARIFAEGPKGFDGDLTTKKYEKIAKCPNRTASRDLADLMEKGAIVPLPGGGRSTRYALATLATMNALGEGNDKPQGADALLKAAGIEDVALYPANPGMRYTGMIVAVDAQTVVQQVAAHTYIAHKASALSPSPQPGQRVSIHQNTVTPAADRPDHGIER
ncbi:MAG: Fic family protein [Gammaproteobacteria bacterium]|nr:Fic family protein [Gammaproteobacteria bacterium]